MLWQPYTPSPAYRYVLQPSIDNARSCQLMSFRPPRKNLPQSYAKTVVLITKDNPIRNNLIYLQTGNQILTFTHRLTIDLYHSDSWIARINKGRNGKGRQILLDRQRELLQVKHSFFCRSPGISIGLRLNRRMVSHRG